MGSDSNYGAHSFERWSNDFYPVRVHKRSVCLCVHALPRLEHLLKPTWSNADKQDARFTSDILEGVRSPTRNKHKRPSGRAHDPIAYFDFKISTHNIEELVLGLVNMSGR